MNATWETLADCLRDEVQEYGGLLNLFEEQQACIFRRDADRLLQLVDALDLAARSAERARRKRETCAGAFAAGCGRSAGATLRSLLPLCEEAARPLLEALINEVNVLIHRLRRIAHQNHLLLAHTVDLQQSLLREFYPGVFTQTYSAGGRPSLSAAAALPSYQAAG